MKAAAGQGDAGGAPPAGPACWRERLAAAVPSRCAVCGAWPAAPVCSACVDRFAAPLTRCRLCALPLSPACAGAPLVCGACLRQPPPLAFCLAAVPYAYPWSGLLGRLKFQAQPGWARTLAGLLHATPGLPEALAAADLLVPMPLAPGRLAQRGFNQALQLARALAPAKVRAQALVRLRETPPQSQLHRAQRQANLRGAFALEPLLAPALRGARILLVDDVMTSGASLHAAARTLLAAGSGPVGAAVVARTEPPP